MSDSTQHLDTISPSQASKEVTANALFDAMSQAALFGRRANTTSALTWGYYGGKFRKADGSIAEIANGTVALSNNTTNYLFADADGVVTKVTVEPTDWPGPITDGGSPVGTAMALYEIVTSGGLVTSYTDWRAPSAGGASETTDIAAEIVAATGKTTPVDADLLALVDSAASFVLKKLTWANLKATLKTYFDTLYVSLTPSVTVVSYSATTTVDLSTIAHGGIARITLTGNITIQLSNGTDGKKFVLELIQDGTGSRTVSLSGTYFRFGTDITSFTATTTASKMDRVGCIYNTTATKADVVATLKGF